MLKIFYVKLYIMCRILICYLHKTCIFNVAVNDVKKYLDF